MMKRLIVSLFTLFAVMSANALSPVSYKDFYTSLDYSTEIKLGVWSGRSQLCLQKAAETGYLMLWFIASRGEKGYDCENFLKHNLCKQKFCDVINNYKYIILCCEDYGSESGKAIKDSVYGFPEPKKIRNENTGKMEDNHRGYPIKRLFGYDDKGEKIYEWCDIPPSVHLLKVDQGYNIIFHICATDSDEGEGGVYDPQFSPYAAQIPIPQGMCYFPDAFAPWLDEYLKMFPVHIDEIDNPIPTTFVTQVVDKVETYTITEEKTIQKIETQVVTEEEHVVTYDRVEVGVTETINPSVEQIALHRDNLLFRVSTIIRDITVKERIGDNFSKFDDRSMARNALGKWYLTYDDTLSAVKGITDNSVAIDIYPTVDCTLELRQSVGNGFNLSGYSTTIDKSIVRKTAIGASGAVQNISVTNEIVTLVEPPFINANISRNSLLSTNVVAGKLYRVTVDQNSTFDVFSTK